MSIKQRRETQQFRESIGSVVRALSAKKIKVTQRGSRPEIVYKDGKPISVNIPTLPDDADPNLIKAIRGFIDMKVASILFTAENLSKNVTESKFFQSVESARVEREVNAIYPGTETNIRNAFSFVVKKSLGEKIKEAKSEQEIASIILDPYIRAKAGSKSCQAFLNEYADPALVSIFDSLIGEECKKIADAKSSMDAYAISERIKSLLQSPPSSGSCEGEDKQEEKGESKGEESEEESSEADQIGKEEGEEQGEGERHSPEEEKQEEVPPSDGVEESHGEGEDGKDEDEEDTKGTEEETDKKADEEGTEPKSEDASEGGAYEDDGSEDDDSSDEYNGGSPDDASDTGGDDKQEQSDGAPIDKMPDDADEAGSIEGKVESSAGDLGEGSGDALDVGPVEVPTYFKELDPTSVEEELADKISETAIEESANNFVPYTRDFDQVIEPKRLSISSSRLSGFREKTRSVVTRMASKMRRLLAAKTDCVKYGGYRSGKLNSSALYRVCIGDDRAFYRKVEHKSDDTAVTLLIDLSGSMNYSGKIKVAMESAVIFSEVLSRLNINFEVLGFTAISSDIGKLTAAERNEYQRSSYPHGPYSRISPITTYEFKKFGGKYTKKETSQMLRASEASGIIMHENLDGDSVEVALNRLAMQPEPRKIMFVFSDGQPASVYEDNRVLCAHLKGVVEKAEKDGFEIVGIGINTTSVKRFYKNNVVVSKIAELPDVTMKELQKILLK